MVQNNKKYLTLHKKIASCVVTSCPLEGDVGVCLCSECPFYRLETLWGFEYKRIDKTGRYPQATSSQRPTHAQDWTTLVATLFCRLQRGVSRVADAICWALSWAWELNLSRCKSLCRHHMDQRLCHTHRFKPLWEGTALCSGASSLESHCWHVVDWMCVSECKRFL